MQVWADRGELVHEHFQNSTRAPVVSYPLTHTSRTAAVCYPLTHTSRTAAVQCFMLCTPCVWYLTVISAVVGGGQLAKIYFMHDDECGPNSCTGTVYSPRILSSQHTILCNQHCMPVRCMLSQPQYRNVCVVVVGCGTLAGAQCSLHMREQPKDMAVVPGRDYSTPMNPKILVTFPHFTNYYWY